MTAISTRLAQPLARRLASLTLAVGLILLAAHAVSWLRPEAASPTIGVPPVVDGAAALGLLSPDERVAFWSARVERGENHIDLVHLADAYLDRARLSGDLGDLQRASLALDRAALRAPFPEQVDVRRALVAFAAHDFGAAMALADAVLAVAPGDLTALSVAGDARLEMGDLAGAGERFERLAALASSPAAWSRQARVAFLTGNLDDARRLVARALAVAQDEGAPDAAAFYAFQLGELARMAGDADAAEAAYTAALDAQPQYVAAMAGLARVHEFHGRRTEAIALLETASARLPQPELVAALGDLYALAGDPAAAEAQYALVGRIGEVAAATGSVYDRQLVLFAADHGGDLALAVARAQAELAVRGDVYGHDALAWALFRSGDLEAAAMEIGHALALATPDPRLGFHAGMIAAARGDHAAARGLLIDALTHAVALSPAQVAEARAALAALGAGVSL